MLASKSVDRLSILKKTGQIMKQSKFSISIG